MVLGDASIEYISIPFSLKLNILYHHSRTCLCRQLVLADSGDGFWPSQWGTHKLLPQGQLYLH